MTMIMSLGDLMSGLHHQEGREPEKITYSSRIPDIALLAERLVERKAPKTFKPGTIVRPRAPQGLPIPDQPLIVVEQISPALKAFEGQDSASARAFMSAHVDTIVGVILGDEYREIIVWSGFLEEVVLDDFQRELFEAGEKSASESRPENVPAAPSGEAEPKPARSGKNSAWTLGD